MQESSQASEMENRTMALVHGFVPWLALAVVVVVLWNITLDFGRAQSAANAAAAAKAAAEASSAVTSTTAGVSTTTTAWVAKVQVDVPIRAAADSVSEIRATARKGSTLTVVTRQDAWLQVKDSAGHLGWIPNDKRFVTLQEKKK